MIRSLRNVDTDQIEKIHEEFYKAEFSFYEMFNNAIHKFSVVDNDNQIITAGSVRSILEIITITDKSKSARRRREALLEIMEVAKYVAQKTGHNSLHVFIQDPKWEKILKEFGFKDCVGKALVYPIE